MGCNLPKQGNHPSQRNISQWKITHHFCYEKLIPIGFMYGIFTLYLGGSFKDFVFFHPEPWGNDMNDPI